MSIGMLNSLHTMTNVRNADAIQFHYLPVKKRQSACFEKCEQAWSYGGKIVLLARNILNALGKILFVTTKFPHKIKILVTRMKLLSIISVPFSLVNLKSIVQKIFKSFSINDKEGVALGLLSFTMTTADAFDSITTFVNSFFNVVANKSIEVLSLIGLPISFAITGIGIISRTIQIAKAVNLYKKLQPKIFAKKKYTDKALLKKNLEEKMGIAEEQKLIKLLGSSRLKRTNVKQLNKLKEKKKAKILRLIPAEALKSFEKLFDLLDFEEDKLLTEQELEEVFNCLKIIRNHLQKKMKVEILGILANFIVISALILFSIGIVSAWPFVLMAIAFLIRLIIVAYQEKKLKEKNI